MGKKEGFLAGFQSGKRASFEFPKSSAKRMAWNGVRLGYPVLRMPLTDERLFEKACPSPLDWNGFFEVTRVGVLS